MLANNYKFALFFKTLVNAWMIYWLEQELDDIGWKSDHNCQFSQKSISQRFPEKHTVDVLTCEMISREAYSRCSNV